MTRIQYPGCSKLHGVFPSGCGVALHFTGAKVSQVCCRDSAQIVTFRAVQKHLTRNFATLRTVIVTAAVHRTSDHCFRSLADPLNLPAPERYHPYTSSCDFAKSCVCKQSLNSSLRLNCLSTLLANFTDRCRVRPAAVLSLASGFSPCPPVSVLVRAAYALPEAFPGSRHHVLRYFPKISLTCHALALRLPDLPGNQPLRFALNPLRGSHYPSPSLLRSIYGCRNLSPAFHPLRLSASR